MWYNKLLSRKIGLFKVMDVKSDVIKIDIDGIPNSISIHRAKSMPTMTHVTTRVTPYRDILARTKIQITLIQSSKDLRSTLFTKFRIIVTRQIA